MQWKWRLGYRLLLNKVLNSRIIADGIPWWTSARNASGIKKNILIKRNERGYQIIQNYPPHCVELAFISLFSHNRYVSFIMSDSYSISPGDSYDIPCRYVPYYVRDCVSSGHTERRRRSCPRRTDSGPAPGKAFEEASSLRRVFESTQARLRTLRK